MKYSFTNVDPIHIYDENRGIYLAGLIIEYAKLRGFEFEPLGEGDQIDLTNEALDFLNSPKVVPLDGDPDVPGSYEWNDGFWYLPENSNE